MSPLKIRMALHYWYSAENWPEPSDAAREAQADFIRDVLIEATRGPGRFYQGTDRLTAYVEALVNTPLPVKKWVIP